MFVRPTYQALIDGVHYSHARRTEVIAEHRPNVLVEDNAIAFPR